VGTFFQELMRAGVYKRSQGRITRQLTFAGVAIAIALGMWRFHVTLTGWSPGFRLGLHEVRAGQSGTVSIEGSKGKNPGADAVVILDSAGQELERHPIPAGVHRRVKDKQRIKADTVLLDWDYTASTLQLFSYALPGLLLLGGLWMSYRLVNVPGFADFLIAVEAEMNKVSWPGRAELFRASMVVLVTIFALAVILAGFDLFWNVFFRYVLPIIPKEGKPV